MGYRLTKAERELMKPGKCTACGADAPTGRNSAGRCYRCHNAQYYQRKADRAAWREEQRRKGREYWAGRGVVVGDAVEAIVSDMLTGGLLACRVLRGVARVGAAGAYVHVPGDAKQYEPYRFKPAV